MPIYWSTGPIPLEKPGGIFWRSIFINFANSALHGTGALVGKPQPTVPAHLVGHGAATATTIPRAFDTGSITGHGVLAAKGSATLPATLSGHGALTATAGRAAKLTGHGTLAATATAKLATPLTGHGALTATAIKRAVSYDATGAGNKTTGATMSWAHTITGNAVLVGISTVGASATAQVGSTSMTQLAKVEYQTSGFAIYLYIFGLLSPPTGAQTINIAGLATGSNGGSVSYSNVTSFGTGVTTGSPGSTGTALSHTVSAAVNDMVFQIFGTRAAGAITAYSQTERFNEYTNGTDFAIDIGDAPGAASVTFTATSSASAIWGSAAVPLIP